MNSKKANSPPGKDGDASQKKRVIRSLFALRLQAQKSGSPLSWVVSLDDVQSAIERANRRRKEGVKALSTKNPANFFKDIVRREQSYRAAWPWSALKRNFIGLQAKGGKAQKGTPKGASPCFEFLQVNSSDPIGELYQQIPSYQRPDPTGSARIFEIQTLELPPEVRRLQREDETFLLQLIVRLRVIETHLGIVSKMGMESLTHLQMGLKLRGAEIDSLFLGGLSGESLGEQNQLAKRKVLVALEAKGRSDDILKSQIEDQVEALFSIDAFKSDVDLIVPMAAKLVAPSRMYIVEFAPIERNKIPAKKPSLGRLELASEAFYDFVPSIGSLH